MIEVSYKVIYLLQSCLVLISAVTLYSFFYLKHKRISFFLFILSCLVLSTFLVKEKYNILPIKILNPEEEKVKQNEYYLNIVNK